MLKTCATLARATRVAGTTWRSVATVGGRQLHAASVLSDTGNAAASSSSRLDQTGPVAASSALRAQQTEHEQSSSADTRVETKNESSDSTGAEAATSLAPAEAWALAGLPPPLVDRLLQAYPNLVAPTPAQLAFLMSVTRGDVDVYYKDYMGRGKTFSLILASLALAQKGSQVVILMPTPHLVQQVGEYFTQLAGDISISVVTREQGPQWNARIILSTPRDLLAAAEDAPLNKLLPNMSHLFVDEPDSQLGRLPDRYEPAHRARLLRVNRHPPPLLRAVDSLLGIRQRGDHVDFTHRNKAHTVWSSATIDSNLRRFVYGRGWARGDGSKKNIIDLNFTDTASDRQKGVRSNLAEIAGYIGAGVAEPFQVKPEHYAFTVDQFGALAELPSKPFRYAHEKGQTQSANSLPRAIGLPPTLVEAVAYLAATAPPPRGTYSLAVVPDSASIKAVQEEFEDLGIPVAPLVPESLAGGIPPPPENTAPPILISTRSAVPGLHLPHLHTVYCLNGLDMSSLNDGQRKLGGRRAREVLYTIIAGRLGRFATPAHKGQPQRVISVVPKGSEEEAALRDMFYGTHFDAGAELSTWEGEL